jgi:hypothetical protein
MILFHKLRCPQILVRAKKVDYFRPLFTIASEDAKQAKQQIQETQYNKP